ncbi:DUF3151 domain-containing protein [Cryobacterium tepidiphilum]|uniref:DUF3151 domain-containing protein n=1 Tax=Cryobacterium tepidiphilum TaxID=2486026 RepID=A0A3M8LP60_9MICO|nr:DUF3151 domain-containing protein [Cryobacterium tepidiphilum]RNE67316.1 DUF3151 domain-containing protein [Cryobacterium tepidiphilum]
MTGDNLLNQPETLLPAETEVAEALQGVSISDLPAVVAAHPTSSLAWAALADAAHDDGRTLDSYAYARVGYHRGLDALRKAGWRGQGPVPWRHEPNRGVLRALYALRRAAAEIGETGEVQRLTEFLDGADRSAIAQIEAEQAASHAAVAPPTDTFIIRGED